MQKVNYDVIDTLTYLSPNTSSIYDAELSNYDIISIGQIPYSDESVTFDVLGPISSSYIIPSVYLVKDNISLWIEPISINYIVSGSTAYLNFTWPCVVSTVTSILFSLEDGS